MKENDIITIVCVAGEYIGKLKGEIGATITLKDPRMLVQNENGMGFAPGVAMTGTKEPKEVVFQQYVFVTETNKEVSDAYRQMTSGIVLAGADGSQAGAGGIQMP